MLSWLVTILLFGVVIVLTAAVFFGWVIFCVLRLAVTGIASLFGVRPANNRLRMPPQPVRAMSTVRCQTRGCQAVNPADARFCRRCGRGLPAAQRVQVRRAAVW